MQCLVACSPVDLNGTVENFSLCANPGLCYYQSYVNNVNILCLIKAHIFQCGPRVVRMRINNRNKICSLVLKIFHVYAH